MSEPQTKKQKVEAEKADIKKDAQEAVEQASPEEIVSKMLKDDTYGRTYCDQLGIDLKPNDADSLFKWLCCAQLFSSGLSEALTLKASRALLDAKLIDTPQKVHDASQDEIVTVLDHKFQRKEQTSGYLHSAANVLLDKHEGSLYKLRDAAGKEPEQERKLLTEIKGLAKVGVDIFFREAQLVWDEVSPFIDKRAADSAEELGLPTTAEELQKLVGGDKKKLAVLAAALVRHALAKANKDEDLLKILEDDE